MTHKVLLVDDEPKILRIIARRLKGSFDIETAESGDEALKLVQTNGPFSVILTDMRMPKMSGVDLLVQMQKVSPDTIRMMLTGDAELETPTEAINSGKVFRFFSKPINFDDLSKGIADAIQHYELLKAEKILLEQTLAGSVKVLMDVLSVSDPKAYGKASIIQDWAYDIAKGLHMNNPWEIKISALLLEIGRVAIPEAITDKINSKLPLSDDEKSIVYTIPATGKNLISNIPRLKGVADIVYYQDKDFDGTGFPENGIAREQIPLGARLIHILKALSGITEAPLPSLEDIMQLERWPERYDPELLKKVKGYFAYKLKNLDTSVPRKIEKLKVTQLLAGYKLLSDLETVEGKLVLAKNAIISESQLQKLRNMVKLYKFNEPVLVEFLGSASTITDKVRES